MEKLRSDIVEVIHNTVCELQTHLDRLERINAENDRSIIYSLSKQAHFLCAESLMRRIDELDSVILGISERINAADERSLPQEIPALAKLFEECIAARSVIESYLNDSNALFAKSAEAFSFRELRLGSHTLVRKLSIFERDLAI